MVKKNAETERRCVLTRETLPKEKMIRFVQAPDGQIMPDLAEKLPGRGIWISCSRTLISKAQETGKLHGAISNALKASVSKDQIPPALADSVAALLRKRALNRLGLEKRAGSIVTGFDKIKTALGAANADVPFALITATDGGEDGKKKLRGILRDSAPVFEIFDRDELSSALGRDNAVHVLVWQSGGARHLLADLNRISEFGG